MTTSSHDIENRLKLDLSPDFLEVIDESSHHAGHAGVIEMQNSGAAKGAGGTHFRIRISSQKFAGLTRVSKHRMIYASIQSYIDAGVHAIAIELTD